MNPSRALQTMFFVALACCLVGPTAQAEVPTRAEMEQVCQNWLTSIVAREGTWAGRADPAIINAVPLEEDGILLAHCFAIAPQGYVVVPALKDLPPVKAYSQTSNLDSSAPDGMADLLREVLAHRLRLFIDTYGNLEAVQPRRGDVLFDPVNHRQWDTYSLPSDDFEETLKQDGGPDRNTVGPLLTTAWHQHAPYNNDCPIGDGGRCFVGCVATATAQIMRYHAWPPEGTGSWEYDWDGDDSCGGSSPGDTLVADLSDPYAWTLMPNGCGGGCTPEQEDALAELCYDVGVAFRMDYGVCGSGAYTADALSVLRWRFSYGHDIDKENRADHIPASWFAIIQEEINAGRPLLYRIYSHAIVCDGWRDDGGVNQYHMNYGWADGHTAWYSLDSLYCPWSGCGLDQEFTIRRIMPADCNGNGQSDLNDIVYGTSADCNGNQIPDECDIANGTAPDCNANDIIDGCEGLPDCNYNGVPDECDIAQGTSEDANENGIPDECEVEGVLYVNASATGSGDGSSWEDAFTDLQAALAAAQQAPPPLTREIWVAAGVYKPAGPGGDRYAAFALINRVGLYGGFNGTETEREERDTETNITVLSGDLNGDDQPGFVNYSDNSYHVITAWSVGTETVVDGFVIRAGNADAGGDEGYGAGLFLVGRPTIRSCCFAYNRARLGGGAVMSFAGPEPQLFISCTFVGNTAYDGYGGAYCNWGSGGIVGPTAINCRFFGNSAIAGGATMEFGTEPGYYVNCVFSGNQAAYEGGGAIYGWVPIRIHNCSISRNIAGGSNNGGAIKCEYGGVDIKNSVLWGNTSGGAPNQIHGGTSATVTYSCVQGGWSGTGNISSDPLFMDSDGADGIVGTVDDDLRLASASSPCIDAGSNTDVPADMGDIDNDLDYVEATPLDLAGLYRFFDEVEAPDSGSGSPPIVDMGAYEYVIDCNGNGIHDSLDINTGSSEDCNTNGIPDECDIPPLGTESDCDGDGVPDSCELAGNDCNVNGVLDSCDIAGGMSDDVNGNDIPDECEADCNGNGLPDSWEISEGLTPDCNSNSIPDECEPITAGDFDGDGGVGFEDWNAMAPVLAGADALSPIIAPDCVGTYLAAFDFDDDIDIDAQDFAEFQAAFTGSGE